MSQIKLLSEEVINKIAAGEVVERPASVIKELVENSIDADSRRIVIDIEEGGLKKIQISDDGRGIPFADAPLAILRHATSKITSTDDLYQVASMGFRGEALSSIASVSKLTLTSKAENSSGFKLKTYGGQDIKLVEHDRHQGTTITIEDLFYNVPARKRFVKTEPVEFAQIIETVKALALSNHHIDFTLNHNSKEKIRFFSEDRKVGILWGETTLKNRASSMWDKETVQNLLYVTGQDQYGTFEALISPPGYERAISKYIYLFVNQRWVKDQTLRFGFMRGYHSHLLKGQFPWVLAYYTTDPSLVDVNVHPAKTEVKFQYGPEIQGLIAKTVRERLRDSSWARSPESSEVILESRETFSVETPSLRSTWKPLPSVKLPMQPSSWQANISQTETVAQKIYAEKKHILSPVGSDNQVFQAIDWARLKFIGQCFSCYLLFDAGEQFLAIDQHAFHERILYEKMIKDKNLLQQTMPLLVYEGIDLPEETITLLAEKKDLLEQYGFKVAFLNEKTVEVRQIPVLLKDRNLEELFTELAQSIKADLAAKAVYHDILSTIACHSAVRKGEFVSLEKLKILIAQADSVDFYHNCPHGRRIFKWFSKSQVEAWFDR